MGALLASGRLGQIPGVQRGQAAIDKLDEWRNAISRVYLTGIIAFVPVLLLVWAALKPPPLLDSSFAFIVAVWLAFIALRLFAPPRPQSGLIVLVLLLTAVLGPHFLSLSPGPFLAGTTSVIMAAVTLGRRAGVAVLLVAALGLIVNGVLITTNAVPAVSLAATDPFVAANWARLTVFFSLNAGLLLFLLTGLFNRVEAAWRATAEAAEREAAEQRHRLAIEARAVETQRLEAIGRLAGGVAHDFNNQLVVIMTWTDMLKVATSEEDRREGLEAIAQASAQAAQMTRQLLSLAKKSVAHPTALDVDAFLATTTKSLRRLLSEEVALEHVAGAPPRALVDESQLGQVVLNLAVNAADAMPKGGTLTLTSGLLEPPRVPPEAPDPAARYVTLTVRDTGVGMDEATRARVFEPFFTTKGQGKGTGLGLASVYGIASQAKGFVTVESSPGHGTTFTVGFPVAPADFVSPGVASTAAPRRDVRHRVLLVEDNQAVRATLATALRNAGIEPVEAPNGDEALVLARRHQGELAMLCTDAVMPGLPTQLLIDGFRQLFPSAPVLVVTGYVEEELVRRGIEEGRVSVLEKPFTAEALVARVNELLAPRG